MHTFGTTDSGMRVGIRTAWIAGLTIREIAACLHIGTADVEDVVYRNPQSSQR